MSWKNKEYQHTDGTWHDFRDVAHYNDMIQWNVPMRQKKTINRLDKADVLELEHELETFGTININRYQDVASGTAIYPGRGSVVGLWYCITKLNGEAGEAAEHIGKAFRDDNILIQAKADLHEGATSEVFIPGQLTPERREYLLKEAGDCLWYLGAICRELGTTISHIAVMNLKKLWQRQERNVLQGSGDDR